MIPLGRFSWTDLNGLPDLVGALLFAVLAAVSCSCCLALPRDVVPIRDAPIAHLSQQRWFMKRERARSLVVVVGSTFASVATLSLRALDTAQWKGGEGAMMSSGMVHTKLALFALFFFLSGLR